MLLLLLFLSPALGVCFGDWRLDQDAFAKAKSKGATEDIEDVIDSDLEEWKPFSSGKWKPFWSNPSLMLSPGGNFSATSLSCQRL